MILTYYAIAGLRSVFPDRHPSARTQPRALCKLLHLDGLHSASIAKPHSRFPAHLAEQLIANVRLVLTRRCGRYVDVGGFRAVKAASLFRALQFVPRRFLWLVECFSSFCCTIAILCVAGRDFAPLPSHYNIGIGKISLYVPSEK